MKRLIFFAMFLWGMGLTACATNTVEPATMPTVVATEISVAAGKAGCPVTQPQTPSFVPPEPYSETPPNGEFWYGSNDLWTALWPEGAWAQLPKDENGYVNKIIWFREGYVWTEEPEPELALSARQLDGDAMVEEFSHATNGYHPDYNSFILTGIALPRFGCWEITGKYNGRTLSFVVWVAP